VGFDPAGVPIGGVCKKSPEGRLRGITREVVDNGWGQKVRMQNTCLIEGGTTKIALFRGSRV